MYVKKIDIEILFFCLVYIFILFQKVKYNTIANENALLNTVLE